ncbi:two-component sensor histidine kinase [Phyllobacterium phragmitis]|uniref:histidine kinase n=1 Tax=Phyllobacterium phragmitis TaxID=2670329 RepID=A0A2S9IJN8_9HYPH|nr:ATP-binding protein [Phyllobacterium phragmitis]PRD40729.1 two-component sensor histidine kinase [Phyllobacterium phragmitis]
MTSIRARLFLILMITTGIVWVSATAWIYLSTRAQVERVLDARLSEAARMVSSLLTRQEIDSKKAVPPPSEIAAHYAPYDRQLSCQIWALDGTLVGRSESAPVLPLTDSTTGFSEKTINGETWRVYVVENAALGMRVMVGDNMRVRDRLVADVIRGLALPALLILPVLAGLIWLSVGKGLAPLNAMARALASRPASDLSPLPADGGPSEIRPVIRSLNGLFARVDAAREHERDFTAFAAHELRTPIAGLKTQAQIALASGDAGIRENALRQIAVGVDRTSRLIRQLTDLTNAESGEVIQDEGRVNVGKALETLAEDIRQHYPQAAVISVEFALFSVTLPVSGSLFMLAARNLLENAVLHSPPDRPVACRLRHEPGFLAVVIDDCGPGIPDNELLKVRDRFFRGRNKTEMGSGLGLAIVNLALQRMEGELHLKNRDSGGLRAELHFPNSALEMQRGVQ